MESQARPEHHVSQQTITNERKFVTIGQATMVNMNLVQMGIANPFAMTMVNPWLGSNNLLFGSTNMLLIRPQIDSVNAGNGLTNSVPTDPRKRSRDAMENQFNNMNVVPYNTNNIPLQGFATQIFANNMKSLLETDLVLSEYSKKIKMQIVARQQQAPGIMCDGVEAPWMEKFKEHGEEILNVRKLHTALQERVKCLNAESKLLKDFGNFSKAMTQFQNVNTTLARDNNQGLSASDEVVADCGENKQGDGQKRKLVATADDGGDVAGKGGKLAGTTDDSSRYRMCKKCGETESCILVLPCKHLCLCTVCADQANLQATCPVCSSLIKGMVRVSFT